MIDGLVDSVPMDKCCWIDDLREWDLLGDSC